jgi:hypothetical protein
MIVNNIQNTQFNTYQFNDRPQQQSNMDDLKQLMVMMILLKMMENLNTYGASGEINNNIMLGTNFDVSV